MRNFVGIFEAKIVEKGNMFGPSSDLEFKSGSDLEKYLDHHLGQDVTVTIKPTSKSTEKEKLYAYYHKVILPITVKCLTDDGFTNVDDLTADAYLKMNSCQKLSFNPNTGKVIKYLADKHTMTKEELTKLVSDSIFLLEERHSHEVPDSHQYKMKKDDL